MESVWWLSKDYWQDDLSIGFKKSEDFLNFVNKEIRYV
jgi:hypothetical protein